MKVGIITNVTNVLLITFDFDLVRGWSWDIRVQLLEQFLRDFLVAICLLERSQKSELALSFGTCRHLWKDYQELVHLTIPAALERLVMRLGQVIYFSLIVALERPYMHPI